MRGWLDVGMTLRPATRLGPYEILSAIGSGGMGDVYKARDTRLHRDVAIKTLPADLANYPARRARFEREAQTISQLNHPNICAIYDIGDADGVAFLVMEYIEGQTLAERLRLGPIPWSTALPWAIEVASAIDAAHRRGIVHRDLKPANIMIAETGVKLLDFGIAKLLEQSDAARLAATASLTSEQQVIGTVHYMAPEQLEGRDVDARTDIFAFGATLYELLTARHAFEGASAASVTAAVLTAEPAPMTSSAPHDILLPSGLEHVVRRALAKNPVNRWQTARDLMIELQSIQTRGSRGPSTEFRQEPASRPKARRSLWLSPRSIAFAVAVVAALAVGARYLTSSRPITLAVVPLDAATGTQDADAIDDGITTDIINKLTQSTPKRLSVIAFSSVRRYRGANFNPQSDGKKMGASMILMLHIKRQTDIVSIDVELVRSEGGIAVWGNNYRTPLGTLFATEDDIALQTLEQLQIGITDKEMERLRKRYTENLEARRHYQTGWSLMDRQGNTDSNYQQSLESFKKAIEIDPNYALAYVGVATVYTGMGFEGFLPASEAYKHAQEAVAKATELEPLTYAASPMPGIFELYQWHFDTLQGVWRRAIELNPDDPVVHKFWARQLRAMGRFTEAIGEGRRARELDPFGVQSNAELATTYAWQGDLNRAIEQYRQTLALDPTAGPVHELLGDAYARAGKYEEAIAETREALTLGDLDPLAAALGADFVTSGYEAAMKKLYQIFLNAFLDESQKGGFISPMAFAQVYAHLRETDKALEYLQKAFKEHHPWLVFVKYDPSFELLRKDPRFQVLIRDIGIPDASSLRVRWRALLYRVGLS